MKRRWKGSYTVEAAYIVPLCTMIVLLMITQILFYHDIVVAEQAALTAAENGNRYVQYGGGLGQVAPEYGQFVRSSPVRAFFRDRSEEEAAIGQYVSELLNGQMWISTCGGISVDATGDNVVISMNLNAGNETNAAGIFRNGLFRRQIRITSRGRDIPMDNRLIKAAWETGLQTKGVSEVLNLVQQFLGKITGN